MFKADWQKYILLALIMLAGAGLRIVGFNDGFPLLTHTDESAVMKPVYNMSQHYTLLPGTYKRPNHISIYVNFIVENTYSFLRYGTTYAHAFTAHGLEFYAIARIIAALFGTGMILVAFLIGEEFEPRRGILSAAGTAFLGSFVNHAHLITPDVPIALFTLLMILLTIRFLKRPSKGLLIALTAVAAINTVEKYPGLISFVLVAYCIFVQTSASGMKGVELLRQWFIRSIKYGLLFLLFVYFISPGLFLDFGTVVKQVRSEASPNHVGMIVLGWGGNLLYYAKQFIATGGIVVALLSLAGIAASFRDKHWRLVIPLGYGVLYWILLSNVAQHWERWALPMYTAPLLLSAYGLRQLWARAAGKGWRSAIPRAVIGGAAALAFLWVAAGAIDNTIKFTITDTRLVALQYMHEKGIEPSQCTAEGYTPLYPAETRGFVLPYDEFVKDSSKRYLILSSGSYARFYAHPDRYSRKVALYDRIRKENNKIAEIVATKPNLPRATWLTRLVPIVSTVRSLDPQLRSASLKGPTIQIYEKPGQT